MVIIWFKESLYFSQMFCLSYVCIYIYVNFKNQLFFNRSAMMGATSGMFTYAEGWWVKTLTTWSLFFLRQVVLKILGISQYAPLRLCMSYCCVCKGKASISRVATLESRLIMFAKEVGMKNAEVNVRINLIDGLGQAFCISVVSQWIWLSTC